VTALDCVPLKHKSLGLVPRQGPKIRSELQLLLLTVASCRRLGCVQWITRMTALFQFRRLLCFIYIPHNLRFSLFKMPFIS
jgi:hypothetical protein